MASMAMLNNQRVEVQPQMWYFTCFNSGKLYQISQKKTNQLPAEINQKFMELMQNVDKPLAKSLPCCELKLFALTSKLCILAVHCKFQMFIWFYPHSDPNPFPTKQETVRDSP